AAPADGQINPSAIASPAKYLLVVTFPTSATHALAYTPEPGKSPQDSNPHPSAAHNDGRRGPRHDPLAPLPETPEDHPTGDRYREAGRVRFAAVAALDPAWLEELSELLRIPSISADASHQEDVRRAAAWVRDFVR